MIAAFANSCTPLYTYVRYVCLSFPSRTDMAKHTGNIVLDIPRCNKSIQCILNSLELGIRILSGEIRIPARYRVKFPSRLQCPPRNGCFLARGLRLDRLWPPHPPHHHHLCARKTGGGSLFVRSFSNSAFHKIPIVGHTCNPFLWFNKPRVCCATF